MSKTRYQDSHFDSVISKYREKEIFLPRAPLAVHMVWEKMISTVRKTHGADLEMLPPHIIDLACDGHIGIEMSSVCFMFGAHSVSGAHVDSVKFSEKIVSSLSLSSTRILRLTPEFNDSENIASGQEPWCEADVLRQGLPTMVEIILYPRSFYILSNEFRYRYKHEILGESLKPELVPSDYRPSSLERRFSIMARDVFKTCR